MKPGPWTRSRGEAFTFVALALVHLALCVYFAPTSLLHALAPSNDAFAVAVYRVARARLSAPGQVFTYDPQVLAGQLAGLSEALGSRSLAFSVLALGVLGVAPVTAFNATLIALHVCFPFIGYVAARAFGLRSAAALITFALWSFGWFFDSLLHYSWYSGRIEWTVASAIALCAAGLAWRVATSGSIVRGSLSVAVVLAVATLCHPIPALFFAAVAVAPLSLAQSGVLGPRRLGIAAPALVPVAIVALVFARGGPTSAEPLATVFRASLLEPLWDALEILGPGNGAPGAARTLARTFCFVGGSLQLSTFRAVGDRRGLPLGLAALTGVVLGYAGAFLPVPWPVDPYFFLIPAFLTASVLTAHLLADLHVPSLLRTGPLAFRVGLGLAALVFVPRAFRAVATYVPELLPTRVERAALDYRVSALVGVNEPLPEPLRHAPPPPDHASIAAFSEQHFANRGRIVTDDAAFAAFLATRTVLPVLGPIAQRGSASADADPTALLDGQVDEGADAELRERSEPAERRGSGREASRGGKAPINTSEPAERRGSGREASRGGKAPINTSVPAERRGSGREASRGGKAPINTSEPAERRGSGRVSEPRGQGPDQQERAIATYLERYAVGWVVLLGPESAFDRSTSGVLEPAFPVFSARVRRVRAEPSWFASGSGRIVTAEPGLIRVSAEPAPDMILRFHFDPRLECRPSCRAHSVTLPGARSSFIGVENPPAEFDLFLR